MHHGQGVLVHLGAMLIVVRGAARHQAIKEKGVQEADFVRINAQWQVRIHIQQPNLQILHAVVQQAGQKVLSGWRYPFGSNG